ncbi:MAG: hypothetical protein ACRD5H_11810 [Nitrososphaerales archaeon]
MPIYIIDYPVVRCRGRELHPRHKLFFVGIPYWLGVVRMIEILSCTADTAQSLQVGLIQRRVYGSIYLQQNQ